MKKKEIKEVLSNLKLELNYLQYLINSHNINGSLSLILTLRRELEKTIKDLNINSKELGNDSNS